MNKSSGQRQLTFAEAILEATDQAMARDASVFVIGLGVPDPTGIFGTTAGLQEKYGDRRVMDMPASENCMTGVGIGAALNGLRPIMTHQRLDFALLAMEQIVNQAAKWHYMFAGLKSVPLVIRMILGRGWGQGPQHSQSLQSWFAHIPGLKVVMPFTPFDAKGLLIASIEDNNPVIFIEHRWLHNVAGTVPQNYYRVPIAKARVVREGSDVTIVSVSYMSYEAVRGADILKKMNIKAEVIDVRTLRPLDIETILNSVLKTGHLVVADTGWKFCGFAGEIIAQVVEQAFDCLKAPPVRLTLPEHPLPTSPFLTRDYYPGVEQIVSIVLKLLGKDVSEKISEILSSDVPHDVPDLSFVGPF